MTFSIVATDLDASPSPEWGVAVASKFLAVGAVVPWARAGSGAVATQALANIAYGPDGLELLASGQAAPDVVAALSGVDDMRAQRQLGVVDANGEAATFTGNECFDWAGGKTGTGYACQGNILTGPEVVHDMAAAFEAADGDLAARMLAALAAGDAAGGDRRGRQSAALMVVRAGGGYGGGTDKTVELRVDDHGAPVEELGRLLDLHRLYFPRPDELDFIPLDDALRTEMQAKLSALGYSGELKKALFAYMGTENLEERWSDDDVIERAVLDHLRR
ncbi:MAG TPA: DUF1028 domain-containing protein [Actinomycetota bacterium]|nr:DUF1028 domain-containing protein [Actinomycetota bacterium]